ncbi:osmoprotectant NAGGN system M42 family peptidase [Sporichthya brevicatena]|uniref:Osmoprotectant NAGGN system M42 family peptidase n=1 Tax=Sporichthya brevicatena TaxID=171442 RepID=A0ABN1G9J5_9ACTN
MTASVPTPKMLPIDEEWMRELLLKLLLIPSPTGRTDQIMHCLGEVLTDLDIPFELTRRGALLATLRGQRHSPSRAVVVHSDTIGMAVRRLKANGRLQVVPIGTHSARFSEGARVTIFTDDPQVSYSGTVLPLKASGHAYDDEVDTQGVGWDHVEVRVDEPVYSAADLAELGIQVGDFVAHHALPEITPNGYVKSRHLDDKAGVAAALAAFKAVRDAKVDIPVTARLLITIAEEVGHGASHGLHADVAEMVSIDSAVVAPVQESVETGVTVAMQDMTGPFDFHLTRKLLAVCAEHGLEHRRDVFHHYRSDVAAAIEAGAEMRAALIGFGTDATHGHERTTMSAIRSVAELTALYLQSDLTFADWDTTRLGTLEDFPSEEQPAPAQQTVESSGQA